MSSRRRRRDRRGRHPDHPEPAPPRPAAKRSDLRRRAAFDERMRRLRRMRNVMLAAFVLSLPFAFLCAPGPLACGVDGTIFAFGSAAVLGLALGSTIRLRRERQEHERAEAAP